MSAVLTLPKGWDSKRLKYVVSYNDEVLSEGTADDKEIDYIEISGVSLNEGIKEISRISFEKAPSRARRVVRSGDILISTVRTYLKAIAKVDAVSDDMIASTGFCVVRPSKQVDSSFAGWVAKSEPFVGEVVSRSVGVSYPAINASELVKIPIPLPTIVTQQRIAAYLDEKTARIDALISKKRALLDHLAEKRQALITQAVTKGLNPNSPLKPSNIPWLGDIPEHWEVVPLRRCLKRIDQGWSPVASNTSAEENEIGVLKLGAVRKGRFFSQENKALDEIPDSVTPIYPEAGDVLLSRANTPDLVGDACYVEEPHPLRIIPDLLYRLKCNQHLNAQFLTRFIISKVGRLQISFDARGTSQSMIKISQSHVRSWLIPLPPRKEQEKISQNLQRLEHNALQATEKIQTSITHLTEYRAALITAAVTGQIAELNHP